MQTSYFNGIRKTLNRRNILIFFSLLAVLYLLVFRFRMGISRYLTMDEFIYYNSATHVFQGYRPYFDFMHLVTPLYIFGLSILNIFFKYSGYILAGRVYAYFGSLVYFAGIGYLFWVLRRSWLALFAVITVMVLPMPFDKILEVRPDSLAFGLLYFALAFAVSYIKKDNIRFLAGCGFISSLAFLTSQKTAYGVVMIFLIMSIHIFFSFIFRKQRIFPKLIYLGISFFIPLGLFFLWGALQGSIFDLFYFVFISPWEHARSQANYQISDVFFYFRPNGLFYGSSQIGPGMVLNNLIWLGSVIFAPILLLKYFIFDRKQVISELLVLSVFACYLILYFGKYSVMLHSQYLIGPAGFVALYFATSIWLFKSLFKGKGKMIFALIYLFLLILFLRLNYEAHEIKLTWGNREILANMEAIWKSIPQDEYIFDLEGRTIYYPYPYPICCLAMGQFAPYVSRPFPSISEALKRTRTKYIYNAEPAIDRVGALPPLDVKFIKENYEPSDNGEFWVAKNW